MPEKPSKLFNKTKIVSDVNRNIRIPKATTAPKDLWKQNKDFILRLINKSVPSYSVDSIGKGRKGLVRFFRDKRITPEVFRKLGIGLDFLRAKFNLIDLYNLGYTPKELLLWINKVEKFSFEEIAGGMRHAGIPEEEVRAAYKSIVGKDYISTVTMTGLREPVLPKIQRRRVL